MPTRLLLLLTAFLALFALAPVAEAADYVPGEVIVGYTDGATATSGTMVEEQLPGGSAQLGITDGDSVRTTLKELRRDPNVAYAVPNYVAHASQFTPDDPSLRRQWNLVGPFGIGMQEAWSLAAAAGAPGGKGAVGGRARQRRRLRALPAASAARRTCAAPRSSAPGTSSIATATPTTATGTART